MQHDNITPRVPPAHAPVRGEGSPAKGPRLQAPPLPSDIRLYSAYLSAYEQYLLGRRELAKLERDLVLVDPKRYVASNAIIADTGLVFGSVISGYTPVASTPRVPVRKAKAAKPVAPLPTPQEAPAVTLPSGHYVPVAALTPFAIEEAYNVLCSESDAGLPPSNNFLGTFRTVAVPPATAAPSSPPAPSKAEVVSKAAKSKARRARRKATKATKVLAAMSAPQLQEEAKKEKILRSTFPKIVVPTIFRSAQGTLQSQAGTPIKYQTTKTVLRKRSPSYLRRLARRLLARFAKPTG
jgi:hypothetical protein